MKRFLSIVFSISFLLIFPACSTKAFRANYARVTANEQFMYSELISSPFDINFRELYFGGTLVMQSTVTSAAFSMDLTVGGSGARFDGKVTSSQSFSDETIATCTEYSSDGNIVSVSNGKVTDYYAYDSLTCGGAGDFLPDGVSNFFKNVISHLKDIPNDDFTAELSDYYLKVRISVTAKTAAVLFFGGEVPSSAYGDIFFIYDIEDEGLCGAKMNFSTSLPQSYYSSDIITNGTSSSYTSYYADLQIS